MAILGVLFDLDQTLVDTSIAEPLRQARRWSKVYEMIPKMSPYKGIAQLLAFLHDREVAVGVVTSGPRTYASRVLNHTGWGIDALVCYHDTVSHKPHPAPLLEGLKCLKILAKDAVAVGDDVRDVQAARRASILSVGALWGSHNPKALIESKPDVVCKSVVDLSRFLEDRLD